MYSSRVRGMELGFLLLLLLLCIAGSQAQVYDAVESRVEGQSLVVECPYSAQQYNEMGKTWCQLREESCFRLVRTLYPSRGRYKNKVTAGRAMIQDDTGKGIVTITMEKLQVQDSGVYWCTVLDSSNTVHRLMAIKLDVYKIQEYKALEGERLSVQCPYNTELYKKAEKAWCRRTAQSTCADLVSIVDGLVTYHNRAQNGRVMIYDNTQTGTVTVTMEKLQTDNAGVYWCTLYEPPNLYLLIEVKLTVTKGLATTLFPSTECTTPVFHSNSTDFSDSQESQSISSLDLRSALLWLGVSALINKVLIAVVMGLRVRRRNHHRGRAQKPVNLELQKAQVYDTVKSRVDGQSLVVECPYSAQQYNRTGKTWCQLREESCFRLVSTFYPSPGRYQNKVTAGRAIIQDDTGKGTVTITMEKLQVQDSGVYWCAVLGSSNTVHQLKAIKLDVYKEVQEHDTLEGESLSVQCPYNTELYKKAEKVWCQRTAQSTCADLVSIDDGLVTYHNRAQNSRATIRDNTQTSIVTVTMEKLQTDDAGVYWCTRYEPPNLYQLIEVKLTVTKAMTLFLSTEYTTPVLHSNSTDISYSQESQSISSLDLRSALLWLGVSALINKVLIAVVMGLRVRRRNHHRGSAQKPVNLELQKDPRGS